MAKTLAISPDLKLPADTVTSTLVVYGGKGMGKTNLLSVLAEELAAAGLRFSALDMLGVLWGLRHSADGKGPGIEVLILGGIHGDIPIEPTGGAVVADLVVDEDANVIIDVSRRPDGTMWSIGERIRFVTDYCKRLYQRQGEKRRPLMQLIDEAARVVPQVIRKGDEQVAACMGAIAVLVEEGRNVGLGCGLFTQRSARLNKDVAELADCMMAFRTPGPNSRRAVLDWLGEHVEKERLREFDEKVRSLPRGTALVVSPGWLEVEGIFPIRMRETFDSSATPKAGQERRASGPGAKPDLAKYRERMAETIEKAKADDPRELKKRLAALEKEKAAGGWITGATAKGVNAKDARIAELQEKLKAGPKRVDVPVLKDGQVKRLEALGARAEKAAEAFAAAVREVRPAMLRAIEAVANVRQVPAQQVRALPQRAFSAPSPRPAPAPRPRRDLDGADGPLPKGEHVILVAAAQHAGGVTREQLTVLTGYKRSSRDSYIQRLKERAFVVDDGTRIGPTAEGLAALGPNFEPLPTGAALLDHWRNKLPSGEKAVLEVVLAAWPDPVDRERISEQTQYQRSSRDSYIQRLRSRQLVTEPARGQVRASDQLFEGGAA